ncbi:unnamed protein product [Prorocentrum cordatum]|uniref:Uncharacterized protein n=1 Tax=Prorocentrum cordatum TaxID=2364126 RepID=A0ABN9Y4A9_9DINO|nr:unnamed protein product [Polarella glacialis]|mmetsp:Transcript_69757/g.194661  ORF Transcript_69757/g.194661 Transcript_69757/m.194661 type:complete len:118 (+) Transcript_69757:74-427(+)
MAFLLARAFGARAPPTVDTTACGSPQTLSTAGFETEDVWRGRTVSVDSAKEMHAAHPEDGSTCKGLLLAPGSEDLHRCGSKGSVDSADVRKSSARAEALRRAEMLARFDHSYGGRRR